MVSSLTLTLSGKSSVLQTDFLPELILDEQYDYSCALIDLLIQNNSNEKITIRGVIHIDCDIISESYINGVRKHTIHQFVARASLESNQILVESAKHLIYFPVNSKNLRTIHLSVLDSEGKQIKGAITARINIKRGEKTSIN